MHYFYNQKWPWVAKVWIFWIQTVLSYTTLLQHALLWNANEVCSKVWCSNDITWVGGELFREACGHRGAAPSDGGKLGWEGLDVVWRGACGQAGCCNLDTVSLLQRKYLWGSRNDGANCQWGTTQSGTLSVHPLVHIHSVIEDTLLELTTGRECVGCCPLMDA